MSTDVFISLYDWSSGQPLNLDAILQEVEGHTEENAYHLVFRRGGHLFAIKAETDRWTEEHEHPPVRRRRHLSVIGAETDVASSSSDASAEQRQ